MNVFSKISAGLRRVSGKKIVASAAVFLTLTAATITGASVITNKQASAAPDCSGNSIIQCGETSRANFIAAVKKDPALQKVYAKFGLVTADDYARFVSSAQPGVALRASNSITVGGRTVATNVGSIGRFESYQGSNPRVYNIAGAGTFYGNLNDKSFGAGVNSIPVDVLFDATGKMQFAVMTSTCANPVYGTVVQPSYACKSLNSTAVAGQANTYNFNTTTTVANGATISKVVYNFGDGTAAVPETNPLTMVKHTFTKAATVTVSVYVSVPGGGTVVLVNCQKAIPFTPPAAVFACTLLTMTPGKIDPISGNQSYTLAASATATNATIKSYSFTLGDSTAPVVVTTGAASASTSHVYAPATHNASVSVTVLTNTGVTKTVTAPACAQSITVKVPECKPGVPMGSPQCAPSTLACVGLTATAGAIDQTTGNQSYSFNASSSVTNGTITSYSFAFDDSSAPTVITTGATTAITTHVYPPGSFTAVVTVTGKDASGNVVVAPISVSCAAPVTVKAPECKPGVPSGSNDCYTYTCDQFTVTQGDNRLVTVSGFKATTDNPNVSLKTVSVNWGDTMTDQPTADKIVGTTHTYSADQSYTITATAHFADATGTDITAAGTNCIQTVSFTAPPVVPPVTPPTTLVNTGAGNVVGLFAAAAIVGTIAYRLFLGRKLSRQN